MNILIDYLRFTSKIHSLENLVDLLGLHKVNWEEGKARDGWLLHEYHGGMHLYHGGRDDIGVELSGSGCRMLESVNDDSFDWIGLFRYIVDQGDDMNVSRLDIAGDDKEELLSMKQLFRYTQGRKYICKARRCVWLQGDEQEIIFGASSSSTRLRIYNKALERGVDGHWIRCEFQLRDEAADSFILNLLQIGEIGETYGGVLLNYLRYTTKSPDGCQNHHDRLDTVIWWDRFVKTARKIKNIKVGGLEYNYGNLEEFILRQCTSSLLAFTIANGGSMDKLQSMIAGATLSHKHKVLLSEMGFDVNAKDAEVRKTLKSGL